MLKFGTEGLKQRVLGAGKGEGPAVRDGMAAGLTGDTRVATTMGWRQASAIAPGDMVLTFDDGMQPVKAITRGYLWARTDPLPRNLWPLEVPEGALGNQRVMMLLPEQSVMMESDSAEALFDDPFALVPAAALDGYNGIKRVIPTAPVEVYILHFERDQVVFANVGALFFCPNRAEGEMVDIGDDTAEAPLYRTLGLEDAEFLIDCVMSEDEEAEIWDNPGRKTLLA